MRRFMIAVISVVLFTPVFSFGQMDQMEKHMKDHMGGGMMGNSENKQTEGFTQEAEAAGVTVKITYKNPAESKNPVFNVVLDTHSVDLDQYKFDQNTLLRDDTGKEYRPDIVSSSGSGHHREATLEFKDTDLPGAKYIELVVEGVAGVDERVFKFELQNEMMK